MAEVGHDVTSVAPQRSSGPGAGTRAGDAARLRFTALYRANFDRVLVYALRRVADRQDALDVAAETFAIVWRRLDAVPEGPGATPWVFGVARRVLANTARARARRLHLHDRLSQGDRVLAAAPLESTARGRAGPGWELEVDAESAAPVDLVLSALCQLPPRHQEVLRLAAWDDLGRAEMARALGCSTNAVAIRLHRARRALQEAYDRERARCPTGSLEDPRTHAARSGNAGGRR